MNGWGFSHDLFSIVYLLMLGWNVMAWQEEYDQAEQVTSR